MIVCFVDESPFTEDHKVVFQFEGRQVSECRFFFRAQTDSKLPSGYIINYGQSKLINEGRHGDTREKRIPLCLCLKLHRVT